MRLRVVAVDNRREPLGRCARVRAMDLLGERLAAQHHVIHGAELRALGTTHSVLRRLLADGVLVRIRRDCFVAGEVWRAAPPWERHQLRARAVATGLCGPGRPFALSHHSSLAVQEVGSFGVDDRVHLVRTDRRRGRGDDVVHVHPPVDARWVAVSYTHLTLPTKRIV